VARKETKNLNTTKIGYLTIIIGLLITASSTFMLATVQHELTVISTPIIDVGWSTGGYSGVTPSVTSVAEGTYLLSIEDIVYVGQETYSFVSWEDGNTNPYRTVNIVSDLMVTATYDLGGPDPLWGGLVEIHAYLNDTQVEATFSVLGTEITGVTPTGDVRLEAGTYTVECTYNSVTLTDTVTVIEGQVVRLDFQFIDLVSPWQFSGQMFGVAVSMVGVGLVLVPKLRGEK